MQAGSVDASPTSGSSPSAATYHRSAADEAGGGSEKTEQKGVFFDKILDNYIWVLHGFYVQLPPVLSPPPACRAGGDEFMGAQLPCGLSPPWVSLTVQGCIKPT